MDRPLLVALLSCLPVLPALGQGGCIPPQAILEGPSASPIRVCQGAEVALDAGASEAAEGQVIVQWIWNIQGSRDTTVVSSLTPIFDEPGVFEVSLEVIDDIGCSSGASTPIHILVSGTPDFEGTSVLTDACAGDEFVLQAFAEQPPMIGYPTACTTPDNGVALADSPSPPTYSTLQVTGQSTAPLASLADLGDICIEIEHSFMGDLVLQVACPNGQSVILHQQGGGGTYLGNAIDDESGIPGECFRYCFGLAPEFGTMEASAFENAIPVGDAFALAPGRYTSVQPLEQLLGCPLNGTWTFSSEDNAGVDDGYLCGWCISFGEAPDSSFIDQGPILGSSPDSSFWSGPGVSNVSGSPGQATVLAVPGEHVIDYTVLDDYGCEHQFEFPFSVGDIPIPNIINNTELGLLCAQPTGAGYTYQWSYLGQPIIGAEGVCFTPPGNGAVSVEVSTPQGCSASTTLLNTGAAEHASSTSSIRIRPTLNRGRFSVELTDAYAGPLLIHVVDALGRSVFQTEDLVYSAPVAVELEGRIPPGTYTVVIDRDGYRSAHRMVVE